MATKTLEIAIIGTNKGATKVFKDVDDAAGTTEGKLRQLGDRIGPAVATAAAAVVGTVGLALKGAFDAAQESAKIGRETERVLASTGAAAWTTADQVADLAQSISDVTGADDELVQSGANLLLTFTQVQNRVGEGNDIFNQATQAALDMSTALGTDMSSASIQLGKALNDPIRGITALSRAGVSFTEGQKDQIRTLVETGDVLGAQKIILAELSKEFGGAAEAAATPVDKLRVKFGNLQEDVGNALVPAVSKAADVLSVLTDSFMALPEPVKTAALAIGGLGTGLAGGVLVVSKLVSMFGDSLKPVMDFARQQFDNVALSVGNMATKFGASQEMGANLATNMSSAVVPALGAVTAAAVIGFGVWSMYQEGQAKAEASAKAFRETLDKQTGAITANTESSIAKTLSDKNQVDNLDKAGISMEAFTSAIADNSKNLGLSKELLYSYTVMVDANSRTRQMAIEKLRAEGGARNEMIAKLIQEKAVDAGLLNTIFEMTGAYDKQQEAIKRKAELQAIGNGMTSDEARVTAEAAAAAKNHADALGEVADELRAQTDPYFAAYKSQGELTDAIDSYNKIAGDTTKSEKEKKDAWIKAAEAAAAYKTDLMKLDGAQGTAGATGQALRGQMNDLAQFGLDVTGEAARNAMGDLQGLGAKADEVGRKNVAIGVTLETQKIKERLDWIKSQANLDTGFIPLEALYAIPFAKGGMVPDGLFTVGEQGPELGVKQGSSVRIFSNPDSKRIVSSSLVGSGGDRRQGDVNVYVNRPEASAYDIGREVRWQMAVVG